MLNGKSGYDYKEVKRWTKKFDALEKEKLIFPINISNSHWTLAVVYMQRKRIVYYDSMSGSGKTYLQGLLRWVVDEAMAKKNITVDPTEWTTERANGIPQQQNGFDCGVRNLQYIYYRILYAIDYRISNLNLILFLLSYVLMILQK